MLPDLVMLPDLTAPFPAPHPYPPQVRDFGGPIMKAPRIVPVFFSNDDPTIVAQVIDFETKVGQGDYWKGATSEYGVGPATAQVPVQLTETATGTIDDSAIQTWLAGKLNADDPAFPKNDGNTIYVLHYPANVIITLGGGQQGTSCKDFGGYHDNIRLDASHTPRSTAYAVIPRCANFGAMSGIDAMTATESHELIEAATDPYPASNPAYADVDGNDAYWSFVLGGGEVGDMCAQDDASFTKFPELPYVVQRTWSNQAALAGHDPCQPSLAGEVYFAAAPVMSDMLDLGQGLQVTGVSVPVGSSKTIPVQLFSDGPTGGPWQVSAKDASDQFGGSPSLELSLDKDSGLNGDTLQLTIKSIKANQYGAAVFILDSKMNGARHVWMGIVGQ
jgi:hypothetical protein